MKPDSVVNRRSLLKFAGMSCAIGAATGTIGRLPADMMGLGAAHAGPAPSFRQAPGFFRFKLGTFEITMVSDGHLTLPTNVLGVNRPEAERTAFLRSNFITADSYYSHTNLCLINTGEKLIMVDAGSGANFQDSAGKLLANLANAGFKPEDVDMIVITHGHPDHIWGIMDNKAGKPRFPNAEYFVNAKEWDYWTDENLASKVSKQMASVVLGARRNLLPVSAKTRRGRPEEEVVPGISLIETPGHTSGHASVRVESGGETLIITGDVVFDPYMSLERPDWHYAYDADPKMAVKTRKSLLDMMAKDKVMVAAYHFPFPGVGHVAPRGQGFRWVPLTWHWQL